MTTGFLQSNEHVGVDPKAYRDAMSEIASPVHIIATDGPAGIAGMTVTALASVSDQPAVLLVCVNRASPSARRFIDNGVFSVNALSVADRPLADIFAGRTHEHFGEKFVHGVWAPGPSGAPLLASALATFDCRLIDVKDMATHHVFFGAVQAVTFGRQPDPDSDGLLYRRRGYGRSAE
jgi:flavin reductase (DIM6/NTAB) family NADH-FMN oxidoreductase RutF